MKIAANNFLFISALGVPLLIIALFSPGAYAGSLLPAAILMLAAGLLKTLFLWVRGKKADREYGDERANYILDKSAKFTFYVMAVVIQSYWAYSFSITGNDGDYPFILLVLFWGSFLAAVVYNRIKH